MFRKTIATAAAVLLAAALSSTVLASADAASGEHAHPARIKSHVSARVNHTSPVVGTHIKILGRVGPTAAGLEVIIQVRYHNERRWKALGRATLDSRSEYSFRDKVSTLRDRTYRVVLPADKDRDRAVSKAKEVAVYGWRSLTALRPATMSQMSPVSSVSMNGEAFPTSIRTYAGPPPANTGLVEYDVNKNCSTLKATVGLEDSSPGGGGATIAVTTDGHPRYSGSFARNQSAPVTIDLYTVFRISVAATVTGDGIAAIGSPQVLCNF